MNRNKTCKSTSRTITRNRGNPGRNHHRDRHSNLRRGCAEPWELSLIINKSFNPNFKIGSIHFKNVIAILIHPLYWNACYSWFDTNLFSETKPSRVRDLLLVAHNSYNPIAYIDTMTLMWSMVIVCWGLGKYYTID